MKSVQSLGAVLQETHWLRVRVWLCLVELCASSHRGDESMWIHFAVHVEKTQQHLSFGFLAG